jgi:hypothetical protein
MNYQRYISNADIVLIIICFNHLVLSLRVNIVLKRKRIKLLYYSYDSTEYEYVCGRVFISYTSIESFPYYFFFIFAGRLNGKKFKNDCQTP